MEMNESTVKEIERLVLTSATPKAIDDPEAPPFLVLYGGMEVKSLERLLPNPLRKRLEVTFTALRSFNDYVEKTATKRTVVFVNAMPESPVTDIYGAIDFHGDLPEETSWCSHVARYSAQVTPEWKLWQQFNGQLREQTTFAEFVEERARDFVNPDAAKMMEIATTLSVKTDVNFSSGIRLSNGQTQLTYHENTTAGAGAKGQLELPTEFELGLQPFVGGPVYKVRARLRYRLNQGKLLFAYNLIDPRLVIEHARAEMMDLIKATLECPVYMGSYINGSCS